MNDQLPWIAVPRVHAGVHDEQTGIQLFLPAELLLSLRSPVPNSWLPGFAASNAALRRARSQRNEGEALPFTGLHVNSSSATHPSP